MTVSFGIEGMCTQAKSSSKWSEVAVFKQPNNFLFEYAGCVVCERIKMTEIGQFLPQEVDEVGHRRKEHIFIRVMRKKYICLILLLLAIIGIANSIGITIGFIDKNMLTDMESNLNMLNISGIINSNTG